MRRHMVAGVIFTTLLMSGCSGSDDPEQRSNESKEATSDAELGVESQENPIPGFTGRCRGYEIWTQNQFQADLDMPSGQGYGAKVRSSIDGQPLAEGVPGNVKLIAVGWYRTGESIYPDNPEGIRGEAWHYVPDLNNAQGGWVADAGVRAVKTKPASGNRSKFYKPDTQEAPMPPGCELSR